MMFVVVHLMLRALHRFLPNTCPEYVQVIEDDRETLGFKAVHNGRNRSDHLDLAMWLVAWERYSLAAVLTSQVCRFLAKPAFGVHVFHFGLLQLSFQDCLKHKYVILEVARDCGQQIAVAYDEAVRKHWESLSSKLGPRFSVADKLEERDDKILRQAQKRLPPPPVAQTQTRQRSEVQGGKENRAPGSNKRVADNDGEREVKKARGKCYKCFNKVLGLRCQQK